MIPDWLLVFIFVVILISFIVWNVWQLVRGEDRDKEDSDS